MPSVKISLPPKCNVKVKCGEEVSKNDILAVGEAEGELKAVDPRFTSKNLIKTVGSQVREGELLARKKSALGFAIRVIFAPTTGRVELLDEKTGLFGIREKGSAFEIRAPVDGEVSDILDNYIEVKVRGDVFNAKMGEGDTVEGELINDSSLDKIISNKVVLISKLNRLNLARVLGLGALGIITLFTTGEDLLRDIKQKRFRIPFLETDGEVFKALGKHIGEKVLVIPKENLIILI